MAQEVQRQSNFNGGELSPQAVGRRDLKAYASSVALCVNAMPMAEGPLRRRPGLAHVGLVRNKLEVVPLTGATLTAPNGGNTAALGHGGMVTTTEMGATEPYVVLEVDFGTAVEIGMVDLTDFVIVPSTGGGGDPGAPVEPPPFEYPWDWRPDENVAIP